MDRKHYLKVHGEANKDWAGHKGNLVLHEKPNKSTPQPLNTKEIVENETSEEEKLYFIEYIISILTSLKEGLWITI